MPIFSLYKSVQGVFLLLLSALMLAPSSLFADVVKPALIEIVINEKGKVDIEARVSIEALLTGINGKYKNTNDAPNAEQYDVFRKMNSRELKKEFDSFTKHFLSEISLKTNDNIHVELRIKSVDIPEAGYTKVPRISLIKLAGTIDLNKQAIFWYYPAAFGDNAVRLKQTNKAKNQYHWSEWQWLRKDESSSAFSLTEVVADTPSYQTIMSYIVLGFEHILPKGWDHILFILGLFFFASKMRPLLLQVTMFTIAHSVTLALAMNGIIQLPATIVEPLIALSIAYVGIENIFSKALKKSRLMLVFLFGLLHGLGFAGVLSDFGLPDNDFVLALISFNIGVELGQITIILGAFLLITYWFSHKPWYRASIATPISLVITTISIYWFIDRLDLNF